MIQLYADNDDVYFGDVNLADGGPRGGPTVNPGAGGWPTIRYYNKKTGVDGASYVKKTEMPPCEELGPKGGYLQSYIEEASGASLCAIVEPYKGCDDREVDYIKKVAEKGAEYASSQFARLKKMVQDSKTEESLLAWVRKRLSILKKHLPAEQEL